tara:strand:- start:2212 stop:3078 length:867 start_codon:yes stop_codon:yes gene_type:complete
MKKSKKPLHTRLKSGEFIVAPGVFDMISAKIANEHSFSALYMTGYGTVASYLGLPDAGLATYTDMVDRVRQFVGCIETPLIADGDTGYGGLLNVSHTVSGYEAVGAAAIQLEDQEFPKKCGHTPGRRVIPTEDMVQKIQVATDTRNSEDFLIIARTDARTSLGLDEALRRGEAYLKAGADILFIESPESVEEMEKIGKSFDVPLVSNMVEGGKTPILSANQLQDLGYQIAIFPATGFLATGAALKKVYAQLENADANSKEIVDLYDFEEFSRLMGFERVWEFEKKYAS